MYQVCQNVVKQGKWIKVMYNAKHGRKALSISKWNTGIALDAKSFKQQDRFQDCGKD
jgi:hypothetical protein